MLQRVFSNCLVFQQNYIYARGYAKVANKMSRMDGQYKCVTHCIFDMDGLLLDTEKIYDAVITEIAGAHGKSYPNEVRVKVLGSTEPTTAQLAVKELGLPITPEEFLDIFRKKSLVKLADTNLMPGAEDLLCHLHQQKIPLAIGTSSGKQQVEVKIKKHKELFEVFHHIVCGSTDPEVTAGKPAPDIFLIAASRFPDKPCPETCLVFEDAPNGVMAARSAGMQVVMVPDSRVPDELRKSATKVLTSLADFKPEEFGLPPFPDC